MRARASRVHAQTFERKRRARRCQQTVFARTFSLSLPPRFSDRAIGVSATQKHNARRLLPRWTRMTGGRYAPVVPPVIVATSLVITRREVTRKKPPVNRERSSRPRPPLAQSCRHVHAYVTDKQVGLARPFPNNF